MVGLAEVNLTKNFTSNKGREQVLYLGIGYLSKVEMGFTVCLKSPQIRTLFLSRLRTATMGAAHSATSTASKEPSVTKRLNSFSTLSRKK